MSQSGTGASYVQVQGCRLTRAPVGLIKTCDGRAAALRGRTVTCLTGA
jgi:hypothetical protein